MKRSANLLMSLAASLLTVFLSGGLLLAQQSAAQRSKQQSAIAKIAGQAKAGKLKKTMPEKSSEHQDRGVDTSREEKEETKLNDFLDFSARRQPFGLSEILPEFERAKKIAEPNDEPEESMQFYISKRLPEGETQLPVERYLVAKDQMELMPQYSTVRRAALPSRAKMKANPEQGKLGAWTSLGPGNVGGRTRAILINPQDPNVMYAAGVAGGVWKSTNAGQSWTPLADMLPNIAVSSLVFDPKDSNIIYAGTGEGFFNSDGVRGLGIFKTTDAGSNWKQLANTAVSDFYYVNDLAVSPNDSQKIYAATRNGVFRSNDGGENWTRVLSTTVQGGCMDLAMRTDQTVDYIFTACGSFTQARIYRNKDAGGNGTWEEVYTESGMGRTSLAIAPSNQSIVYAISASIASGSYNNGLHAVFRSMSGGDTGTWEARVRNNDPQKINTAIFTNPLILFLTDCKFDVSNGFANQGWYDNTIAIDPLDPNRVWAGGIDLFRSDDGGANWGVASYWWVGLPNVINVPPQYAHADQHFITFHPNYDGVNNQTMFVGGDGGVYRTDNARAPVAVGNTGPCDPGNSQVHWMALNNGYGVTQFYHGSVTPDGKSYFGGTQDNGTVRGTDADGANAWEPIFGGDGGYTAYDHSNPNTLYTATTGISIRKSTDNGKSFGTATFGFVGGGFFINPYTIDPSDADRLYAGGQYITRTANGAALWTPMTLASSIGAGASALAVAPTDANYLLAGLSNGGIFRTNRAVTLSLSQPARSSSEITATPRSGTVSWVTFDPTNRDIAYATYSTFGGSHVWRTIDGGLTWTAIDGSGDTRIPDIPVHCIVVDPSNTARLYVGTDLGVFVSTDGGAKWSVENNGFANTVTETLVINVAGGVTTLYAFTHGRGAYKVILDQSGCNYSLSPKTQTIAAAGGDAVVNITVEPGGCNWQAVSNVPWITVAPNSSGNANGSFGLKIEANKTFERRSGTVSAGGRSFTVVQDSLSDLEPPTIAIQSPTNPFNTSASSVNLIGTAADNVRVASVSWRSDRGVSGVALGTTTWVAQSLPLVIGRNEITVTATDDSGNSGSSVIVINVSPAASGFVIVTVAGTGTFGYGGDGGQAQAAGISRPIRMAFDGVGNLYFADYNNHVVRKVSPGGVITTVAGNGTAGFNGDGAAATAARLNFPLGVAVDKDGNLYIADGANNRIRKVTAATGVITTVAGNGSAGFGGDDGAAISAQLNGPENVAVDKDGNLYIADFLNHRVRKVATDGKITTLAGTGTPGFNNDGIPAKDARLTNPNDVAVDANGNVFISDVGNQRVRKVNVSDGTITTAAGSGVAGSTGDGGDATSARLNTATSIALDAAGNLYIADRGNLRIRRVNASDGIINTIAGGASGFSPDGAVAIGARLNAVTGVAVDSMGVVYLTDRDNFRVRKLVSSLSNDNTPPVVVITSPTSTASFDAMTGAISLGGTATDNGNIVLIRWANNRGDNGLAIGSNTWTIPVVALQSGDNNITVTAWDANGNAGSAELLVRFNPQQSLVTIAGTGVTGSGGDGGPGTAATLFAPTGITVDGAGNIYFTDGSNHRVRKVTPSGQITAFAGTGRLGNTGDGGAAIDASMNSPTGIVADGAGNVYISDTGNHRVRKISTDGRITTIAGTGRNDFGGDGGQALDAFFSSPSGLALDGSGNLLIVDRGNFRVRKLNLATGVINTVAGNGLAEFDGDGGLATEASLYVPAGVAVDAAGNIYICDQGHQRIRRVSASDNKIRTIAGNGMAGYNGDGIAAESASLNNPFFMAVDSAGDLYIADQSNHRVRKVNVSSGLISTVAGTGISGSAGEPSSPIAVQLASPTGVAIDATGQLFVADRLNHRIRRTRMTSEIGAVSTVSAASFVQAGNLTPESIVAAFGMNLATGTESAVALPLPTTLAGTTVRVRDSVGAERLAPLFFAAPDQINYLIPNGVANGLATIIVTNGNGLITTGTVNIATVSPGLFTANANGQGVAAAVVFRRKANGEESYEPVATLDPATNRFIPLPIDLGAEGDQVFLIAYGTGFQKRSSLTAVTATIGGINSPVSYAGITPGFVGLDQANLRLDRSLIGKGEVDVVLTVEGKTANAVRVNFK